VVCTPIPRTRLFDNNHSFIDLGIKHNTGLKSLIIKIDNFASQTLLCLCPRMASLPDLLSRPGPDGSWAQFCRILGKLESIPLENELSSKEDEDAFIDDILLQLELWAGDIRASDRSLEWADELDMVSVPLRSALNNLEQHTEQLSTAAGAAVRSRGMRLGLSMLLTRSISCRILTRNRTPTRYRFPCG